MGLREYEEVIEALCDAADIDDVADLLHHGLVSIGEVPARLAYFEPADQCRVSIDLGASAEGYAPDFCRLMLASNLYNATEFLPVLAMEPETGHAILLLHIPLFRLQTDLDLFELLTDQIEPVLEAWEGFFQNAEQHASTEALTPATTFI